MSTTWREQNFVVKKQSFSLLRHRPITILLPCRVHISLVHSFFTLNHAYPMYSFYDINLHSSFFGNFDPCCTNFHPPSHNFVIYWCCQYGFWCLRMCNYFLRLHHSKPTRCPPPRFLPPRKNHFSKSFVSWSVFLSLIPIESRTMWHLNPQISCG